MSHRDIAGGRGRCGETRGSEVAGAGVVRGAAGVDGTTAVVAGACVVIAGVLLDRGL